MGYSQSTKDFRKASEANDEACRRAYYAGRNDGFNNDPQRAYAEPALQECYAEGRWSASSDRMMDADRSWG